MAEIEIQRAIRGLRRPPIEVQIPAGSGAQVVMPSIPAAQRVRVEARRPQEISSFMRRIGAREVGVGKPELVYEGLTPEEEQIVREYGPEEVMRRRTLAAEKESIEGIKKGNIQLPSGEWVSKEDFGELGIEAQGRLKELGVKGYNRWVEGQEREFRAGNVEFRPGEWIPRDKWDNLGTTAQAKLRELGIEGYNKWVDEENRRAQATPTISAAQTWAEAQAKIASMRFGYRHIEIRPGEFVSKAEFEKMPPEEQTRLRQLGVEGYNKWVEAESIRLKVGEGVRLVKETVKFREGNVEIRPGEWVAKSDWDKLDASSQAKLRELGVRGYNEWIGKEGVRAKAEEVKFKEENIEVRPGEFIPKADYNELDEKAQRLVRQLGVEGYNRWVDEENTRLKAEEVRFRAENVEIRPGEFVPKEKWDKLTPSQKKEAKETGQYTVEISKAPEVQFREALEGGRIPRGSVYVGPTVEGGFEYEPPPTAEVGVSPELYSSLVTPTTYVAPLSAIFPPVLSSKKQFEQFVRMGKIPEGSTYLGEVEGGGFEYQPPPTSKAITPQNAFQVFREVYGRAPRLEELRSFYGEAIGEPRPAYSGILGWMEKQPVLSMIPGFKTGYEYYLPGIQSKHERWEKKGWQLQLREEYFKKTYGGVPAWHAQVFEQFVPAYRALSPIVSRKEVTPMEWGITGWTAATAGLSGAQAAKLFRLPIKVDFKSPVTFPDSIPVIWTPTGRQILSLPRLTVQRPWIPGEVGVRSPITGFKFTKPSLDLSLRSPLKAWTLRPELKFKLQTPFKFQKPITGIGLQKPIAGVGIRSPFVGLSQFIRGVEVRPPIVGPRLPITGLGLRTPGLKFQVPIGVTLRKPIISLQKPVELIRTPYYRVPEVMGARLEAIGLRPLIAEAVGPISVALRSPVAGVTLPIAAQFRSPWEKLQRPIQFTKPFPGLQPPIAAIFRSPFKAQWRAPIYDLKSPLFVRVGLRGGVQLQAPVISKVPIQMRPVDLSKVESIPSDMIKAIEGILKDKDIVVFGGVAENTWTRIPRVTSDLDLISLSKKPLDIAERIVRSLRGKGYEAKVRDLEDIVSIRYVDKVTGKEVFLGEVFNVGEVPTSSTYLVKPPIEVGGIKVEAPSSQFGKLSKRFEELYWRLPDTEAERLSSMTSILGAGKAIWSPLGLLPKVSMEFRAPVTGLRYPIGGIEIRPPITIGGLQAPWRQFGTPKMVRQVQKAAREAGEAAAEVEQFTRVAGIVDTSSSAWPEVAARLQAAQQRLKVSDSKLIGMFENLRLTPKQLARIEKESGITGLERLIRDVQAKSLGLSKAEGSIKRYYPGSSGWAEAMTGAQRARVALGESTDKLLGKLKPRFEYAPDAGRSVGWDDALRYAQEEVYKAKKSMALAEKVYKEVGLSSNKKWLDDSIIEWRNAEAQLENWKIAAKEGKIPPDIVGYTMDWGGGLGKPTGPGRGPLSPEVYRKQYEKMAGGWRESKPWEVTREGRVGVAEQPRMLEALAPESTLRTSPIYRLGAAQVAKARGVPGVPTLIKAPGILPIPLIAPSPATIREFPVVPEEFVRVTQSPLAQAMKVPVGGITEVASLTIASIETPVISPLTPGVLPSPIEFGTKVGVAVAPEVAPERVEVPGVTPLVVRAPEVLPLTPMQLSVPQPLRVGAALTPREVAAGVEVAVEPAFVRAQRLFGKPVVKGMEVSQFEVSPALRYSNLLQQETLARVRGLISTSPLEETVPAVAARLQVGAKTLTTTAFKPIAGVTKVRGPLRPILPPIFAGVGKKFRGLPEGTVMWQQGIFKKVIPPPYSGIKPFSEYNPVPKGQGSPYDTFRILGRQTIEGEVDLGVTDIAFDKGIGFSGGGLRTNVGKRHPSPSKGMTIRRKEPQFVRAGI